MVALGIIITIILILIMYILYTIRLILKSLLTCYKTVNKHYWEPVKDVSKKSEEEEHPKPAYRTPFDIIDDLLEGRVNLEDETTNNME